MTRKKCNTIMPSKTVMRMVDIRRATADHTAKTVEVVVATDNPVERYDEERGEVIQEVLSMDGVMYRGGKNRLPIVDSHDRSTVRNVLGSVRNLRVDGGQLVGDATFAKDANSQEAYDKLMDGHLDDFSITASPRAITTVDRGSEAIIRDQTISGPADIITEWMPTDASLVPVGADETSTVRRSYTELKRGDEMTSEQRQELIEKGMPEDIDSTEDALRWALGRMDEEEESVEKMDEEEIEKMDEPEADAVEKMDEEELEKSRSLDVQAEVKRALKVERTRQREIKALCKSARLERSFADDLCERGVSLDVARQRILDKITNTDDVGNNVNDKTEVNVTAEGHERLQRALGDALIVRADTARGRKPREDWQPAADAQDFKHASLLRMAQTLLEQQGVRTSSMTNKDIAMVALGHPGTINRMRYQNIVRTDAYHTTGSFANILLDAVNKTLVDGYEEATFTWNMWARQGSSVSDLKDIHRVRYSEFPDPEDVPEGHVYKDKSTSDQKETYAASKKGALFTISWESIVDDDLDAFSRVPAMMGAACRRKQNKLVYSVLTDNAAMSDGTALFASGHANNAGSTGAPSVTTLNAAYTAMMTQTNLGGEIIGVEPRFLIGPPSLRGTILQLLGSFSDPAAGGSAAGNSNTLNIFGPGGPASPLVPVIEPQLEAASSTGWYMAAAPTQVDTVELTFLQGEESPVIENDWDLTKDVYVYKVRQTFGVKAIDWRGLYRNTG